MKATVNGVEYVVGWRYDQQASSLTSQYSKIITVPYLGTTECSIKKHAENMEAVTGLSGVACCSKKDQFVKAVGRKRSFERAIAGLPRAERAAWWAEFWKNFKQGAA